jgi:hypothetical protein
MFRSAAAVVAGYFVMVLAVFSLFKAWRFDINEAPLSPGFMVLSIAFGFVAAVAGGYVTALIARRAPLRHAAALAAIGLILALINLRASWGTESFLYQLAFSILPAAGVLVGGYLFPKSVRGHGLSRRAWR